MRVKIFIVGAGIIGLAIARRASISLPNSEVHVIDDGGERGTKPSFVNSGVVHSGIYYRSDSLRAKFCLTGNRMIKQIASELGVPVQRTGKLIVANSNQREAFESLLARAKANGVKAETISSEQTSEIQPGIPSNSLVLRVKSTSVIDPVRLMNELKNQLISTGVRFYTARVGPGSFEEIELITGQAFDRESYLVNAAGRGSLGLAQQSGVGVDYALVPVRGRYLKGLGGSIGLNFPIYGLPKTHNFALGNHLTPGQSGGFSVGPSAEIDVAEIYKFNPTDWVDEFLSSTETGKLFSALQVNSMNELRDQMLAEASQVFEPIANLDPRALSWGNVASRSQLVRKVDGAIQDDFIFLSQGRSIHILNVVSPGWTSSPAIAKFVIDGIVTKV